MRSPRPSRRLPVSASRGRIAQRGDGGFSGGNLDRPALKRLLADIEAGKVERIVVYKIDRLSRSLLDFARLAEFFEAHGASVVSITQQLDTSSSMGRLTLNMLLSFAQFEREMVSDRTRDKMRAARRRGKWTGGMPPLGYDVAPEGGKLVVNEGEADQVRAIFRLYAERGSLVAVSQELGRKGSRRKSWKTRDGRLREGKPWDPANLRRVIRDPVYVGKMKLGDEVFPGEHEAVVPRGLFERVQFLLRENRRTGGAAARNRNGALLRGLLRCKSCDSGMIHTWTRNRHRLYRYYTCSNAQKNGRATCPTKSIPAAEVEKFVVDRIRIIGSDPELRRETFQQALRQIAEERRALKAEAKRLTGEIERASREVDRLVAAVAKAAGEAQRALLEGLEKAQSRLSTVEDRLREIRAKEADLGSNPVDDDDLGRALKAFDPIWDVLHTPEKERILRLLIERIDYDGRTEDLSLTFRPMGIAALAAEVNGAGAKS
ncbi:MAG: recombinase family protein [Acidobacteria bacterium]|nr:recombinase family protein [Acidobacteriota bacterium]